MSINVQYLYPDCAVKPAVRDTYGEVAWRKANTIEYRNVQNVYGKRLENINLSS